MPYTDKTKHDLKIICTICSKNSKTSKYVKKKDVFLLTTLKPVFYSRLIYDILWRSIRTKNQTHSNRALNNDNKLKP